MLNINRYNHKNETLQKIPELVLPVEESES